MPTGLSQQVFRYDVAVGTSATSAPRHLARSETTTVVDGYRVTIGTTSMRVGSQTKLVVHITKNGKPASDLHPYLAALAHAVLLNERTLKYEHAHPTALDATHEHAETTMAHMNGMNAPLLAEHARSSPDLLLHVSLREAGAYKAWLQFRGGGTLHVASFVIVAR